ncbi:L,D-transpeptidase [Hansschlegelia zhihuaiae]|uniref:L,D-transpeptidase n=1 Tax=Hansschlegelia zhihuaiae TaxID=405005 RepID=A0A4Q0MLY0_9HYPH|nr:L,D-transpeptidase [Hansschlegelia zhihuaiae]RXF74069.1 L,D-transpeptidase [Hansschlegelia zhihuaiae]
MSTALLSSLRDRRSPFQILARGALVALLPLALAACVTSRPLPPSAAAPQPAMAFAPAPLPSSQPVVGDLDNTSRYGDGLSSEEPFPIRAVNTEKIDPRFLKQTVPNTTGEAPGTIVIDPHERHLYLVQDDGTAIRYGVGVGREGFAWSGQAYVRRKLEWPDWHPPAEMVARDPKARPYADGMPGGPTNPLGARSMALWQGDKDTLFRIHGTIEPYSIGKAVSSGCIRMLNQDVIDLYERVPLGTKVVVRS